MTIRTRVAALWVSIAMAGCATHHPTSSPAAAPPAITPVAVVAAPPPTPMPAASVAPPPAAAAVPDQPYTGAAPEVEKPYRDIIKLKEAGFSEEFLLNKVRSDGVPYQLTTSEILQLRAAGISEAVIQAMLLSGRPAAAGAPVSRRAEFAGLARSERKDPLGVFGTSAKKTGTLVVEGDTVRWYDKEDPEKNFAIYVRNIKEFFNTCVLRPEKNLCLEFGFVTHTGDTYRFRDPGWRNGENRIVQDVTTYFHQSFPNLFFTERTVEKM